MFLLGSPPARARKTRSLTFVYLGHSLPDYALASLRLAIDLAGMNIELVCNRNMQQPTRIAGLQVIAVEDFYDPHPFEMASRKLVYPRTVRDELWHRSLERLFVLEQLMMVEHRNSIIHAELDQLLFRLDMLLEKLDKISMAGILVPFHSREKAVASVLYCNQVQALQSLSEAAVSGPVYRSEMHLLASWAVKKPQYANALPTVYNVLGNERLAVPSEIRTIEVAEIGGVVDAAQLGQWVGGIDPRNVPYPRVPRTKFVDEHEPGLITHEQLQGLKFAFDSRTGQLFCNLPNNQSVRLYNLHLHSKIHPALARSAPSVQELIDRANANSAYTLPGTRRIQIQTRTREAVAKLAADPSRIVVEVSRRSNLALKRRPSSEPFLSGDTFRAHATHVWERGNQVLQPSILRPGDVVFCEADLLEAFADDILEKISFPIVLLLGNSERIFDVDPISQLTHSLGLKIFAQNLKKPLEGYDVLPVGLENAWRSDQGVPKKFRRLSQRTVERRPRILSAFSLATQPEVRFEAREALAGYSTVDTLPELLASEYRKELHSRMFAACPPGNSEDTHAMWEAMYLGCVPIVLDSFLTQEWKRLGLPIWVVKTYEENALTDEDSLASEYSYASRRFGARALWFSYWLDRIENTRTLLQNLAS